MKKIAILICTLALSANLCNAGESNAQTNTNALVEASAQYNIPSGVFKADNGVVIVYTDGRFIVNGTQYEITHVSNKGNGSYELTISVKIGGTLNPQYEEIGTAFINKNIVEFKGVYYYKK